MVRRWVRWGQAVAFFLVLIWSAGATAQDQTASLTLAVVGTGHIFSDNVAAAKNRAIADSLVAAVDLAVAPRLSLETRVANFNILEETFFQNVKGVVQNYKVLAEQRSGKLYRVLVQVTLTLEELEAQLTAAGLMVPQKALPQVLLLVAEQDLADPFPRYWWGSDYSSALGSAEIALLRSLGAKGFGIIDRGEMVQYLDAEDEIQRPDLTDTEVMRLGNRFRAEVVVFGTARAQLATNTMGEDIRSFKGEIALRALRIDTGKEIGATTQTVVSVNADDTVGAQNALFDAGNLAGEDLASQIGTIWLQPTQETGAIEVVVSGTSRLGNYIAFRRAINAIKGVTSLQVAARAADTATLLVDFIDGSQALADALMMHTFDSFGLGISDVAPGYVRIELTPQSDSDSLETGDTDETSATSAKDP